MAALAARFVVLLGVSLPCWGYFLGRSKENGARCSHHTECRSNCCLLDLGIGGAFCAAKARRTMACLPQTKGAVNFICPCRLGLSCTSKDVMCAPRCHLI